MFRGVGSPRVLQQECFLNGLFIGGTMRTDKHDTRALDAMLEEYV